MTTAQRETIVQRVGRILDERISLVRWFRQNACQKHGLPFEENSEVRIVIDGPAGQAPPTGIMPAAAQWPAWAKAAVVIAGGSTLVAGGAGLNALLNKPPPTVSQPAEGGSLLQYLEDSGMHLPAENKP